MLFKDLFCLFFLQQTATKNESCENEKWSILFIQQGKTKMEGV